MFPFSSLTSLGSGFSKGRAIGPDKWFCGQGRQPSLEVPLASDPPGGPLGLEKHPNWIVFEALMPDTLKPVAARWSFWPSAACGILHHESHDGLGVFHRGYEDYRTSVGDIPQLLSAADPHRDRPARGRDQAEVEGVGEWIWLWAEASSRSISARSWSTW